MHVNEPGRTEWEGFETATRAAAAGGVTTIVDMPLNSIPPTTTVAALEEKQAAARGQVWVDVGFWGGAVPGNLPDLSPLHEAGVFGFKCFLLDSGVEEFPHLSTDEFADAIAETARLGTLMLVHAEDAGLIDDSRAHGTSYAGFLDSRPPAAEERAIDLVLDGARRTGGRAHVVHLSASEAIPALRAARLEGVDVSVETCPHYLTFDAAEIPDGSTEFKCCPPIRDADNRDRLWDGLAGGDIDLVVTDHSPCVADLKRRDVGDFALAWGGIASLQLGLPAVWTGARERGHGLADVVRWMATAPADRVGLSDRGRIEVGASADVCVFAPDESFVVDPARLLHRNPVSAYAGRTLTGTVRQTWLHGVLIDVGAATAWPAAEERGVTMGYYVPRGGLPPQTDLTTDRAVFTEAYAVHPARHPARHHRQPAAALGGHPVVGAGQADVGIRRDLCAVRRRDRPRRRLRAARARPGGRGGAVRGGRDHPPRRSTASTTCSGPAGTPSRRPGCAWTVAQRQPRRPPRSTGSARPTSGSTASTSPTPSSPRSPTSRPSRCPTPTAPGAPSGSSIPTTCGHDMHVNIVNFEPGGSIPFPETHVMEHGLYVLEGKAVYLLNRDWVEVQAGDFMWLRAFCPQACYAGGPGRFRYLLYKDVNRHPRLGPADTPGQM